MSFNVLRSPSDFLQSMIGDHPELESLRRYEEWWKKEGIFISQGVDRSGTPWLRMYDVFGKRVDEIMFPNGYRKMLYEGYKSGTVWKTFEHNSLLPSYLLGYVTAFFDTGLYCPYIVSLSTAVPIDKYGDELIKSRYLDQLLRKDENVWQGATWMTESGGGSDLGAWVETVAIPSGDKWLLTGEKYFASNAGAELAVVAARPEGAKAGVRGLALFLLPRFREDGQLNYTIRRLKDKIGTRSVPTGEVELEESEAYLLGEAGMGIYLILEVLNLSRVANSIGSVALAQRAMSEALNFSENRIAFEKPVIQHPLLLKQFDERFKTLQNAFALAWETLILLENAWRLIPPYSDEYHLFRLMAHLAKYWTAEIAVQASKWAMEVHGGMGVLSEYGVERLLREAMILPIWEGTPHRQILDGMEVMERKKAHRLMFDYLSPYADPQIVETLTDRIESLFTLSREGKESGSEQVFNALAEFTAETLRKRLNAARNGQ